MSRGFASRLLGSACTRCRSTGHYRPETTTNALRSTVRQARHRGRQCPVSRPVVTLPPSLTIHPCGSVDLTVRFASVNGSRADGLIRACATRGQALAAWLLSASHSRRPCRFRPHHPHGSGRLDRQTVAGTHRILATSSDVRARSAWFRVLSRTALSCPLCPNVIECHLSRSDQPTIS